MQWIKTRSATRWNKIHGSTDHVWGSRYFARKVKDPHDYFFIMSYIDNNPVTAGLAETPPDWQASGAYYKARNLQGLVDFSNTDRQPYITLLSPIPPLVERLLPPAQREHVLQYYGIYAATIDRLYKTVSTMPRLGDTATEKSPAVYLHHYTDTADFFIHEYDGVDTFFATAHYKVYHPNRAQYQQFSLSNLKSKNLIALDFSWSAPPN